MHAIDAHSSRRRETYRSRLHPRITRSIVSEFSNLLDGGPRSDEPMATLQRRGVQWRTRLRSVGSQNSSQGCAETRRVDEHVVGIGGFVDTFDVKVWNIVACLQFSFDVRGPITNALTEKSCHVICWLYLDASCYSVR